MKLIVPPVAAYIKKIKARHEFTYCLAFYKKSKIYFSQRLERLQIFIFSASLIRSSRN